MFRIQTFLLGGSSPGEREHASFDDELFQLLVGWDRAIHSAAGETDGRVSRHVGDASPQFITACSVVFFSLCSFYKQNNTRNRRTRIVRRQQGIAPFLSDQERLNHVKGTRFKRMSCGCADTQ